MEKRLCEYCGKSLKSYVSWKDWSNRRLHYTCYKKKQDDIALAELLKSHVPTYGDECIGV